MDARSIEILTSSFWPILKAGISFTIPLTLISFALGTTLAVFVAIIRISKVPVLNKICELYVWIIRGTPLLVQLFLVFFGLPKVGVVINPMPSGILVFTLSIGAYSSEIIRAAILSIPKGQWEAAMSLGMSYPQQLLRIILPQAFKISVPPLFNSFIALVKDTSLAANITIPEMFLTTQRITARNYEPLLMYIEVGFIYLIFCTVLNYVQKEKNQRNYGYAGLGRCHMLQIKHLNKYFGENHVLKDISLEIESHKTMAIIGSSGSGKSTLLRCINLLETPDSGTISLDGKALDFSKKLPKHQKAAFTKKTGMVFQSFNLFPHKTALENIMEGPVTVLKKSKAEACRDAIELLKRVGLEDKKDSYPHQLSGGQQQRIAIARALAMKPEILLFDEPTSALDPELGAGVLSLIKELSREDYTIIVVTHNMSFAREVSEEVVFVEKGEILAKGSYDELVNLHNDRITQFLSYLD